jgi:hypothetical protein
MLARSILMSPEGLALSQFGTYDLDDRTPFAKRWGGWYVTGTHGDQAHMGNVVVRDREHPEQLDTAAGANVTDLSDRFETSAYLTGHSDIVALMVLEHQTQMQNRITAAGYQARLALYQQAGINKALGRPADEVSESTERRFRRAAEDLLKYLLFVDEAPLTAPVAGTSGFAEQFAARGPHDRRGRSLRDFDLQSRLFKHPCSYLIDSEAFAALPRPVKDHVYHRLWEVLTGRDQGSDFAHLSSADRQAILEILRETRSDLPEEWHRG